MENITITNLAMMDVADYPIYIRLGRRNRGPAGTETGHVRNIFISNVIATGIDPMSGIQITGIPNHPIEGVRLQNIRLMFKGGGTRKDADRAVPEDEKGYPEPSNVGTTPAYGLFARHVRDLELSDIRVGYEKEDQRPALTFDDVDGLEIDHLKLQAAPGIPPAHMTNVKNLLIRNTPALDGIVIAPPTTQPTLEDAGK